MYKKEVGRVLVRLVFTIIFLTIFIPTISALDLEEIPYDLLPEFNYERDTSDTILGNKDYDQLLQFQKYILAGKKAYASGAGSGMAISEQTSHKLEYLDDVYWWLKFHLPNEIAIKPKVEFVTTPGKYPIFWKQNTYDLFDGSNWTSSNVNDVIHPKTKDSIKYSVVRPDFTSSKDTYLIKPGTPESIIDLTEFRSPKGSFAMPSEHLDYVFVSTQEHNYINYTSEFVQIDLATTAFIYSDDMDPMLEVNSKNPQTVSDSLHGIAFDVIKGDLSEKIITIKQSTINHLEYTPFWFVGLDIEKQTVLDHILTTKKGTSVHYATIFILLSRELGIPARLATGFVGYREHYELEYIYDTHLHAWPEVYYDGVGWIPVDLFSNTPEFYKVSNATLELQESKYLDALAHGRESNMSEKKAPDKQQSNDYMPNPDEVTEEELDMTIEQQLTKKLNCSELDPNNPTHAKLLEECYKHQYAYERRNRNMIGAVVILLLIGALILFISKKVIVTHEKQDMLSMVESNTLIAICRTMAELKQESIIKAIVEGYTDLREHFVKKFELVDTNKLTAREFNYILPIKRSKNNLSILTYIFEKAAYGNSATEQDYDLFIATLTKFIPKSKPKRKKKND
ncbi:MAG: transglutaminase-like domain-containing protein [Nanoarchaeota archaeon]|nr:transglutaminase-like domain-containing protein [Nanoarchaeota archaeon]